MKMAQKVAVIGLTAMVQSGIHVNQGNLRFLAALYRCKDMLAIAKAMEDLKDTPATLEAYSRDVVLDTWGGLAFGASGQ